MNIPWLLLSLLCLSTNTVTTQRIENDNQVVIAFIVEDNSACILPYFLGTLDRLTYPKEKITLWVRVEKKTSRAIEIIGEWTSNVIDLYSSIDYQVFEGITEELSSLTHDDVILSLREEALLSAKQHDYIIFMEPDLLIEELDIIDNLIDASVVHRALVASPLLTVPGERYANFMEDISDKGVYSKSDDYDKIINRELRGCFSVSLVHTIFLIHLTSQLNYSLSFNSSSYKQQSVDTLYNMAGFSKAINEAGGKIIICNNVVYGETSLPITSMENGVKEKQSYLMSTLRRRALNLQPILPTKFLHVKPSHLSEDFDMIYIINLKKRRKRNFLMQHIMFELGIENYRFFEAIDGKLLNDTYLQELQILTLPGYEEPYTKRKYLTQGEIGCFLSHYFIWKEAKRMNYRRVLVLEDDATPIDNMLEEYEFIRRDVRSLNSGWDLLYFGRKILDAEREGEKTRYLMSPGYSYWMVAYALSDRGIDKVLSHRPLSKMLPADEYIPILYDQHPNEEWKTHFVPRNLKAYATNPRLMFPAHYPGDDNYISDTEHIGHDDL